MMKSGSWQNETFKPYNLEAKGTQPKGGTLHPLLKVCFDANSTPFQRHFSAISTPFQRHFNAN